MFVSGLDFQMSFKIVQSQFPWVLQAADVRLLSSAQNHIHTYTYNNFAAGFFLQNQQKWKTTHTYPTVTNLRVNVPRWLFLEYAENY